MGLVEKNKFVRYMRALDYVGEFSDLAEKSDLHGSSSQLTKESDHISIHTLSSTGIGRMMIRRRQTANLKIHR